MSYVRVSVVQPKRGREAEVERVLIRLAEHYSDQPGNITSYVLQHLDGHERYGRLSVWETEDAAEHAAQGDHDLALRSELMAMVDEGSHEELSFAGTEVHGARSA